MFKEITNSIKAILYERAVSPLSGILAIVWIGFNWKALVILCWGPEKMVDRISLIESNYVDPWTNFYYPAIITVVVTIAYPFVALGAFALWEKVSAWKLMLKQSFEGTVALPVSKSLAIWTEIREKDKQFNTAIEAKDNRILELERQNKEFSGELKNLKESLNKGTDLEVEIAKRTEQLARLESKMADEIRASEIRVKSLSDVLREKDSEIEQMKEQIKRMKTDDGGRPPLREEELKILFEVANAEERDERLDNDGLLSKMGIRKVELQFYVDDMVSKNYISKKRPNASSSYEYYELQQPGRQLLVDLSRA